MIDHQSLSLLASVHRCFRDGQYEQAVGIALEARRLDKLEQTIKSSPDMVRILTYSLHVCQTLVISREFRQQVIIICASDGQFAISSKPLHEQC